MEITTDFVLCETFWIQDFQYNSNMKQKNGNTAILDFQ